MRRPDALLTCLQGIKVKWIASGPAACHSVIGDADGRCWTWGRNEVSGAPAVLGRR